MRFMGLGGVDEVGGSSYLFHLNNSYILVDAGLRPTMVGEASVPALKLLDDHPPSVMFITHAHLDHVGALPLVIQRFPKLEVYATPLTQALSISVLTDAIKVGQAQGAPLYDAYEVARALERFRTLDTMTPEVFPWGQVTAYPAGHIPGAVSLLFDTPEGKVFHTADFSNIATLITVEAYRPDTPIPVDAIITESTYGDTTLPGRKKQIRELILSVKKTIDQGGRVLIPTFALGRAQELILLLLNHQVSGLLPVIPIYLDGLVRQVTDILSENLKYMPEGLQNVAQNLGHSPFERENVIKIQDKRMRQEIINTPHPCVILASSGMLSGGVSPIYARKILGEVNSALFIVGYQDAESPGRRLLELEKGGEVMLPVKEGYEPVAALCQINRYYLSAHADRVGISAHISRYPSPRVFLMHGEGGARESLIATLKKDYFIKPIRNEMWVDLLEEITLPHLLEKKNASPAADGLDDSRLIQPTSQAGKIKRFRVDVSVKHDIDTGQVIVKFPEHVLVSEVMPEGDYRVTMTKSSFNRLEFRELAPLELEPPDFTVSLTETPENEPSE